MRRNLKQAKLREDFIEKWLEACDKEFFREKPNTDCTIMHHLLNEAKSGNTIVYKKEILKHCEGLRSPEGLCNAWRALFNTREKNLEELQGSKLDNAWERFHPWLIPVDED
jgi:hypothetical protein